MAITDIQISEELETNAPSIKYRGNEGPKSPQEMEQMIMASLEEEYLKYVDDMMEQGIEPMSLEQFLDQAIAEGQMSKGPVLPSDEDPINPFQPKPQGPVLPDRQMAAYGGIMGMDGRRQYGIGSKLKRAVRKIIPNEVAKVAEVAAPFVAPFNPLAAGLMSGIGGFDRTGRIGSSLKSGLMNYGMGQIARGIGGGIENLQTGINPFKSANLPGAGDGTFSRFFSNPINKTPTTSFRNVDANEILGEYVDDNTSRELGRLKSFSDSMIDSGKSVIEKQSKNIFGDLPKLIKDNLSKVGLGNNLVTGLLVGGLGAGALMGNMKPEEIQDMQRGEGLDIEGIRTEVIEAMKDPSGEALKAIRIKYPFLGTRESKDIANMAMGGRIGYDNGGGVIDVEAGIERLSQSKFGRSYKDLEIEEKEIIIEIMRDIGKNVFGAKPTSQEGIQMAAQGGRIGRAEGGIMDLGGMEKDYRNTGGFVDIGEYEKKDDVPARLSVNEFVMTADAVRGMGDGNIDLGAKRMENLMGAMENKKGAQQMFDVSERLSEVV